MTQAIPNMNPTGVIGSGGGNVMPGQAGTPFSTFMPGGTGGPGNMGFGNSTNPNPPQASPHTSFATPQGSATPSTASPTGGAVAPGTTTMPGQGGSTLGELQKVYGDGMGSLIYQYLQSNGGYNSAVTGQAVAGQINGMQQQIQLGADNLTSMLGTEGVTGSGLTNSLTNYENTATTQENAVTSQEYYNMWNESQNRELGLLEETSKDTATYEANQFNWEDALSDVIGLGQAAGSVMTGIGVLKL